METLEQFLKNNIKDKDHQMEFIGYFYKLMDKYKVDGKDIYKSMNMSRQLYSRIISGKIMPSLKSAVKLALGIKCTNSECKLLLKKVGYTLPSSNKSALIIRYCFENKIYDYFEINKLLIDNGCESLD